MRPPRSQDLFQSLIVQDAALLDHGVLAAARRRAHARSVALGSDLVYVHKHRASFVRGEDVAAMFLMPIGLAEQHWT
jgi:hypothetical protein